MEKLNIKALESWIHLNKVSGEKNDTLEITCDENQSESPRSCQVVILTSKGKSVTLLLLQKPGVVTYEYILDANLV